MSRAKKSCVQADSCQQVTISRFPQQQRTTTTTLRFTKLWNQTLVVQWLGIHQPMQGTWVGSLVREDSTCLGQLSPWATTTEPTSEPTLCSKRGHYKKKQLEKARRQWWRPRTTTNKWMNLKPWSLSPPTFRVSCRHSAHSYPAVHILRAWGSPS